MSPGLDSCIPRSMIKPDNVSGDTWYLSYFWPHSLTAQKLKWNKICCLKSAELLSARYSAHFNILLTANFATSAKWEGENLLSVFIETVFWATRTSAACSQSSASLCLAMAFQPCFNHVCNSPNLVFRIYILFVSESIVTNTQTQKTKRSNPTDIL